MAKMRLTDEGGKILLGIALGDEDKFASLDLRLFTGSQAAAIYHATDGQSSREEIIDAACTVTIGLEGTPVTDTIASLLSPTNPSMTSLNGPGGTTGVPYIQWDDVTWTFSGALQNAVNKTVRGMMIVAGSTIIAEQVLAVPFTPSVNGETYTVTPKVLLGNVPGYNADPA